MIGGTRLLCTTCSHHTTDRGDGSRECSILGISKQTSVPCGCEALLHAVSTARSKHGTDMRCGSSAQSCPAQSHQCSAACPAILVGCSIKVCSIRSLHIRHGQPCRWKPCLPSSFVIGPARPSVVARSTSSPSLLGFFGSILDYVITFPDSFQNYESVREWVRVSGW